MELVDRFWLKMKQEWYQTKTGHRKIVFDVAVGVNVKVSDHVVSQEKVKKKLDEIYCMAKVWLLLLLSVAASQECVLIL